MIIVIRISSLIIQVWCYYKQKTHEKSSCNTNFGILSDSCSECTSKPHSCSKATVWQQKTLLLYITLSLTCEYGALSFFLNAAVSSSHVRRVSLFCLTWWRRRLRHVQLCRTSCHTNGGSRGIFCLSWKVWDIILASAAHI